MKTTDQSSAVATRLALPGHDPGRSPGALETTREHRPQHCSGEAHLPGASGPDNDPECLRPRGWGPSSRFGRRLVSDQHAKSWPRIL